MSDDTKLREESIRGSRAKEWLENPIYREAWEKLRLRALDVLEEMPLSDAAGREEIHHMLSVMNKVRRIVEDVAKTGTLANAQMNQPETMMQRLQRRFA